MTIEVPGVRPAVISDHAYTQLDELRGFRHVVRNIYTFKFNPHKLERLVTQASPLYKKAQSELLAFAKFLEEVRH